MVRITYKPQKDDPVSTEVLGIKFEANKAVDIDEKPRTITSASGQSHTLTADDVGKMINMLRNNKWFEVADAYDEDDKKLAAKKEEHKPEPVVKVEHKPEPPKPFVPKPVEKSTFTLPGRK